MFPKIRPTRPKPRLAASYERYGFGPELTLPGPFPFVSARAQEDRYGIPDSPEYRFVDHGAPKDSGPARRPDFQRLMQVVEAGAPFTRVYMYDAHQLGELADTRAYLHWLEWFADRGITVHYVWGMIDSTFIDALREEVGLPARPMTQRPMRKGRQA